MFNILYDNDFIPCWNLLEALNQTYQYSMSGKKSPNKIQCPNGRIIEAIEMKLIWQKMGLPLPE